MNHRIDLPLFSVHIFLMFLIDRGRKRLKKFQIYNELNLTMYGIRFMNAKISAKTFLKTVFIHFQFKIYCHLKIVTLNSLNNYLYADYKFLCSYLSRKSFIFLYSGRKFKKSPSPSFMFIEFIYKFNIHEPIHFR